MCTVVVCWMGHPLWWKFKLISFTTPGCVGGNAKKGFADAAKECRGLMTNAKSFMPSVRDGSAHRRMGWIRCPLRTEQQKNLAGERVDSRCETRMSSAKI